MSAYNVGGLGSIPGLGRSPGEGNGTPFPVLLPGKSHGQRNLVGNSLWVGHDWATSLSLFSLTYTLFYTPEKKMLIKEKVIGISVDFILVLSWGLGCTDKVKPLRLSTLCYFSFRAEKWSVQFSHSVMSDSLPPHGLQHSKIPCPSPTPRACSNSCSLSRWCHPTISSSIIPFSSCLQSFPASGSFLMSQLFASGCQSIGVSASASVFPINIQDWFLLGLTSLILHPRDSQEFSATT